ncbi:hypothetical protein JL193_01010 [Polaribacter batillariae]|uniref:TolB-like 6-blade propeller-like n=1 Tax=Polaribacter batillariae TaxID=2808900 RepID=A0ABX7SXD4_9FLAO|nr:BF3164 family lipoprotein [Polaribacter batillariae]QTD37920.1 hypothetical protein JL193_01010 [Polaribacter batillariae]
MAKDVHVFSDFPVVDTVTFNNLFEHQYGGVDNLILKDSLLITFNNHGRSRKGYQFTSYNLLTFENFSFFPFGKGPCEVLGAQTTGILGNQFWMYDITTKKFLFLKLKDIIPGESGYKENCVSLSIKKDKSKKFELGKGFLINDTTYVCTVIGSMLKNKLAKITLPNCEITKEYGNFNQDNDNKMFSLNRKAHIERSFFFAKPDNNNVVALAYFLTDKFEIFNLENNESSVFWGPHKIKNEFDVNKQTPNPYPQINDKTQVTYVGGYATKKHVYLIYSGNYFRKNLTPNGLNLASKSIYVFDWTGKVIKKIVWKEDVSIRAIAISENEDTLYAFDENSNYVVTSKLK